MLPHSPCLVAPISAVPFLYTLTVIFPFPSPPFLPPSSFSFSLLLPLPFRSLGEGLSFRSPLSVAIQPEKMSLPAINCFISSGNDEASWFPLPLWLNVGRPSLVLRAEGCLYNIMPWRKHSTTPLPFQLRHSFHLPWCYPSCGGGLYRFSLAFDNQLFSAPWSVVSLWSNCCPLQKWASGQSWQRHCRPRQKYS